MSIRRATKTDVPQMVDLSERKRSQYETFQPLFWRKAVDSRERQTPFFESLLANENFAIFVHESGYEDTSQIDGFIIANLRNKRECSVDDFVVADENKWEAIGKALLQAAGDEAKQRGIAHYLVVCGYLDAPKRQMLHNFGLQIDRYWYTAATHPFKEQPTEVQVRPATTNDQPQMAELAGQNGRQYDEIGRDKTLVWVCEAQNQLIGYAIALVIATPPVYDPGGPTCLVLESVVASPADWAVAGRALLQSIQAAAAEQDAVQYVVVCEQADPAKQKTLQALSLPIASEWYVGEID